MIARLFFLAAVVLVTTGASAVLHAEQAPAAFAPGGMVLTENETLGKKMYQQRCSICHSGGTAANPPYGGTLTSDNVQEGRETFARMLISQGSAKMPGFQYGLEPREIDNIVLYLKKIPGKASVTGN